MWAIIATFYVSMARQQGFCIKLWPMEKGWVCETVISLIYQAGHLMTDNFNFSVKLADWLLKHPSLLTGMAVSGYLLLEPSNSPPPALLILISSSKESGLDPNHSSPSRSRAVMASHGLNVTLSSPLWKGPCAHEKIKVLGGYVPWEQSEVLEVGVGVKIKEILLYMEWIRGSGVQILHQSPFCFLHRQRIGSPEEKSLTACMCMTLHEKEMNVTLYWVTSTHYPTAAAQNAMIWFFQNKY